MELKAFCRPKTKRREKSEDQFGRIRSLGLFIGQSSWPYIEYPKSSLAHSRRAHFRYS